MDLRDKVVVITGAAARQIVHAIEHDCTRRLVGADARLLDLLVRLFPRHASGWVRAVARRQRQRA